MRKALIALLVLLQIAVPVGIVLGGRALKSSENRNALVYDLALDLVTVSARDGMDDCVWGYVSWDGDFDPWRPDAGKYALLRFENSLAHVEALSDRRGGRDAILTSQLVESLAYHGYSFSAPQIAPFRDAARETFYNELEFRPDAQGRFTLPDGSEHTAFLRVRVWRGVVLEQTLYLDGAPSAREPEL